MTTLLKKATESFERGSLEGFSESVQVLSKYKYLKEPTHVPCLVPWIKFFEITSYNCLKSTGLFKKIILIRKELLLFIYYYN